MIFIYTTNPDFYCVLPLFLFIQYTVIITYFIIHISIFRTATMCRLLVVVLLLGAILLLLDAKTTGNIITFLRNIVI